MTVIVEQSSDMKAGFARLRLPAVGDLGPETLRIDVSLPDGKHLNPSGRGTAVWGSAETWFAPESSSHGDEGLVLELGPSVTWHLKPNQPYLVSFRDHGGHKTERVERMLWPVLRLPSTPPPPMQGETEPSPPPEVDLEPENDTVQDHVQEEEAPITPAPSTEVKDTKSDGDRHSGSAKNIIGRRAGRFGLYHWIGLAIVLVVLGFLFQPSEDPVLDTGEKSEGVTEKELHEPLENSGKQPEPETPSLDAEDALPPDSGEPVDPGSPPAETPVSPTLPSARSFLKESPSASVAFEEAERYSAVGERDGAFLLLKYAARQGSPEAALRMGNLYDPATHTEAGVISEPDAARAADWYERAAKAGNADARSRLDAMRKEGLIENE